MNVLMTADTVGGVWQYALELADALAVLGVRVDLATMGRLPDAAQRADIAARTHVELHESEFRLEWMDDCWADVDAAGHWLLELERSLRPDVVHLNGYSHAALPWRAPVLVVAHSCVLSWWRAAHGSDAPAKYLEYRQRVARGLHAADAVIAPTAALLAAMEPWYGALPHACVIANARSPEPYYGLPREAFVLAAGRVWDESKNLMTLARVAPRLGVPVRIAGPQRGPDGRDVVLPNVEMLGPLSQHALAAQYARAAVYALPARYEPFGLSALEAALSGCALVLGDIATLREVWGDAALFVPPDDGDALSAAIRSLFGNPQRRAALARAAYRRARSYAPARMAQAYLAEYRALRKAQSPQTEVATCAS